MANIIKPKRSTVANKVPTTSDIVNGEIAINSTDKKIYTNAGGTVTQVGAGALTALSDVVVTTPTSGQSLSYDGTNWVNSNAGAGDVVGAASSTDNAITRFDGTTGKIIQNSTVTLDDNGNIVNANSIGLDTTPATVPATVGTMSWDDGDGVPSVLLKGGNTTLQVGTQEYARVYNDSGATLTKGQVVYISGAQGNRVAVKLARANVESTSFGTIGLVAESIANGAEGFIIVSGALYKLNTTGLTAGAAVYLSPTTAGAYTTTEPQAPNQLVILGFVERVSATVGSIYVKIDNGYELTELHDVQITSPASGNTLIYDAAVGVWKNANITAGTGVSVTNGAGSISIANTGVTSAVAGTGISVSGATGAVTITNNDRGSSQNIFKNVAVAGQSTIVADGNDDTLTIAAGTGITLTTNATTDTLTITGTGGTVTSVGGTGTVNGLTLTGTVTTTGNLTLGGTLSGTASGLTVGAASSATFLNSSNYINRTGSTGNLNTDFQNTPAGSTRIQGDDGGLANSPGNYWWFYQNMRHSNGSNFWGTQVAWGWEDNANRLATRNITSNNFGGWVYYLNSSNYSSYSNFGGNAVYGGIYYDGNDTSFYIDPNSSSRINNLQLTGGFTSNFAAPSTQYAMDIGGTSFPVDRGIRINNSSGSAIPLAFFVNSGATFSGYILTSGATAQYLSASDYRLKHDIETMDGKNALNILSKTRPVTFKWNKEHAGKHTGRYPGFIAHELQEAIPEAVSGEKDQLDEKGNIFPQAVDPSKLTPFLVASILELQSQIKEMQLQIKELQTKAGI